MEAKESGGGGGGGGGGGVTVVGSDAPTNYHIAPRNDTSAVSTQPPVTAIQPAILSPGMSPLGSVPMKKKRGRPRKYAADGSVIAPSLSPKPISSSSPAPPVINFSIELPQHQPKVRPVTGSVIKQHKPKFEVQNLGNCSGRESWGEHRHGEHHHGERHGEHRGEQRPPGDWVSCSVGANFTPHIITVNAGEDVTMKIISFSQQGPRAICILSANGVISSVTLRQADSSGGTLTYEGRFEILSLTGSFMPSESGGMRNRTGGMSVSLASPDGRVVGGGVAGLLVAASPVQIVVGSFLAGNQHDPKPKKQRPTEHGVTSAVPISSVVNFHGLQGLHNHSSG